MPELLPLAGGVACIATGLFYPSIDYVPVGGGEASQGLDAFLLSGSPPAIFEEGNGWTWSDLFALNPDLYVMMALIVVGVILVIYSIL